MLIHNSVPFQVNYTVDDTTGRFTVAQGTFLKENIYLVNAFGPNNDN